MPPKARKTTNPATKASRSGGRVAAGAAGAGAGAGVTKKTSGGDRKRVQNRIAQQCLRERRAASNRHMDNMLEAMSFATEADPSRQYSLLLDAHLKLIKENQAMEDALFRLRKKLLSLSNAAAMAADDPVFEEIMGKKQWKASPESSAISTNAPPSSISGRGRHQPQQKDTTQGVIEVFSPLTADITVSENDEPEPTDQILDRQEGLTVADPNEAEIKEYVNLLQPSYNTAISWFESLRYSPQPLSAALVLGNREHVPEQNILCQDYSLLDTNDFLFTNIPDALIPQKFVPLPSPWDISAFPNRQKLAIISCNDWSARVLRASHQCISRAQSLGILKHLTSDEVTQQVAVAAVNLLSLGSGMQKYVYACNGAAYLERVIYWRLSTAARSIVPEPFKPTPLQAGTINYPTVDFYRWPEIRDQIILAGDSINLDTLYRDVFLNVVVDIPEENIAVNVFQHYEVRSGSSASGMLCSALDPEWIFFEISQGHPDFVPSVPDPVEEAIFRELCRRLQSFDQRYSLSLFPRDLGFDDQCVAASQPTSPLGLLDPKFSVDSMAVQHGLANAREWKLSKEFGKKYPFLDCSSATTSYEMKSLPFTSSSIRKETQP